MPGVFISYRQADSKGWAAFLRDELIDVFDPEQVFLDSDTLRAGSWRDQIAGAVAQCNVTLVVIGKSWLTVTDEQNVRRLDRPDDVHRHEIAEALARAGMRVIPVLVDNATMPDAHHLPEDIRALSECQARRFSDNAAHREVDVRALVADIDSATGIRRRTTAPVDSVRFLPFVLDESAARESFANWASKLKLAPRDLPQRAAITSLTPVWLPLWLASARCSATWRGKKGETRFDTETVSGPDGKPKSRQVSRVEFTELDGTFNEGFNNVVIDAGAAPGDKVPTLLDEASAQHAQSAASLPGGPIAIKAARVDGVNAQTQLRVIAERRVRSRALAKLGGTHSEITQFHMQLDDVALTQVHCPAFEGRYRYAGTDYAFWVNADSGNADGDAPLSKGKLALIAAMVGVVLVAVAVYFFVR